MGDSIRKSIDRHYRKHPEEGVSNMFTLIKNFVKNIKWTWGDTYAVVYHVAIFAGQQLFIQFKIENPQLVLQVQGVAEILRRLAV